jgi:hypothetical protein
LNPSLKSRLRSLLAYVVLVRTKRPIIRPVYWDKAGSISVDSAEGLFRRNGETIAIYSISAARVSIQPTHPNPDRIILYRESGRGGLCIFYYRTDPEHILIACHKDLIRIQRDHIPGVRSAFRKFTRTNRSGPFKPPGKEFTEYLPPKEKAALKE